MADVLKTDGPSISITGKIPGTPSFQDYDVQFGKNPMSRDEYKGATFMNSGDSDGGNASFMRKAELMGGTGSDIIGAVESGETYMEKKEEAAIEPK